MLFNVTCAFCREMTAKNTTVMDIATEKAQRCNLKQILLQKNTITNNNNLTETEKLKQQKLNN